MMTTWETSVGDLLRIFRDALVALLPAMQRACIPWKTGEAYDEWDEICQTLYRNIVARSLVAATSEDVELDAVLPRYDMKLQSYADRGVLLVSSSESSGVGVFVGLSSKDEPFDTVDCLLVDSSRTVSSNLVQHPFDAARQEVSVIDRLRIDL
jgi:hypothetical protein